MAEATAAWYLASELPAPGMMRQYRLVDFDPALGASVEEWAAPLVAEGWSREMSGGGVWIELSGRRVWRWALYRDVPQRG